MFELAGKLSVSQNAHSDIIIDAGHSLCLPDLLVVDNLRVLKALFIFENMF